MNTSDQETLRYNLVRWGIKDMELYNELYDHIATSYENREDKNQPLQAHIDDVFLASFGGYAEFKKDIANIRHQYIGAFYKSVWKKTGRQFYSGWVLVPLIGALVSSIFISTQNSILNIWEAAFFIPLAFAQLMIWTFRYRCRTQNLPFSRSIVNREVRGFSVILYGLLVGLPDIVSRIFLREELNILSNLSQEPAFIFPITFLMLTHAFICIMLLVRKFNWKPVTI